MARIELPLKSVTDPKWAEVVKSDFSTFLQDHAACERKAAALAMSLVAKYPDRPALIEPMVALAREELEHFSQVYRILQKKGIPLSSSDKKDDYVNLMIQQLRHGREERFLDRLVMSGIVEARGYERFHLLAKSLEDQDLHQFYHSLAEREAGHYKIFIKVALQYFSKEEVDEAIERISFIEAQSLEKTPLKPILH